ncbi:Oidioi.mRNA.OKI2018_I69.XSR.g16461.t1.cds [Oikopleura dioica]|uniref:Oidioi.mRNA.OKI2018_I69.XSR.g16461.t1.cds n=1 Tax=Oikopleura dioica TaxID=34765 RepID=A0ABN7SG65_OIKDI|nr:Oidioi.mRNA.OKI2018_I69.XSR.g16461.t1.cds [Oikopleura dioica]
MNSEEVPQGPQLLPHEVRDLLGIMSSQSTNDDEEDSSQLNDSTITVEDQDDDLQNFSVPDSQEVEEGAKEDPMNFWDDVEEEAQVVEEEVIAVNDSTNDSENCFEVDMHDENEMGEVTSSQEASSQEKSSLDNSQSSQEESFYVMSSQGSQDSVDFVPETQSTVNGNEVYVIPETQDEIEHNMDMYGDDPEGDSDDSGEDWNIYNINAQNIHHWESWNRQGRYEGTNMTYPEWLEREEQNERMMALEDEEDHMPIGQLFAQRYQEHGLGEYMNEQVAEEESSEEDEDERWRIEARNRRQRRRAAAPPPDNDEVICLDSD